MSLDPNPQHVIDPQPHVSIEYSADPFTDAFDSLIEAADEHERRAGRPPLTAETDDLIRGRPGNGDTASLTPTADPDALDVVDWGDLFAGVMHEEPVVDGLAFAGRWTSVAASAKTGKSTLMLHVSVSAHCGIDPFDGTTRPPLNVMYLDPEMGRVDMLERLEALGLTAAELVGFVYVDVVPKLDTVAGASKVLRAAQEHSIDLLVIDGVNGAVSGAENDDTTWRAFYDFTISPLKRAGVAIITNDNLGKDRSLGPRGSSVKVDKPDAIIQLSRTDAGTRLRTTHRRTAAYALETNLSVVGADGSQPVTFRYAATSWPAGTREVADLLDDLNVPTDAGRRVARQALTDARDAAQANGDEVGAQRYRASDNVLNAALRHRRSNGAPTP